MAARMFNESGELVGERERALQTICQLVDESGVDPGPGFWVEVERMRTSELYVRIRKLAQEAIVDEHARWSDLVVLALDELETGTTMSAGSLRDEILLALDRLKAAAIRTASAGSTVDVAMRHIYGIPQKPQAAASRDFSVMTIDEIEHLARFRAAHANN